MGIDRVGGTESRAENTEAPQPQESPQAPPPERPSRLESLRATREAQAAARTETTDEQEAAEQSEPELERSDTEQAPETDTGTSAAERETEEPAAEADPGEPSNPEQGEQREGDGVGSPPAEDRPTPSEPAPATDQPQPADDPGRQPQSEDAEEATPEGADEREEPQTREAEDEQPPLPQQDDQLPENDTEEPPEEPNEVAPMAEAEPANDDQTSQDEPDPSESIESQEASGSPRFQTAWQQPDAGVSRWTSPIVQFNDRTHVSRPESRDRNAEDRPAIPATPQDESNRYRTLPDMPREGTPGHGDLVLPEDDPAGRDHTERAPERDSRKRRFGRDSFRRSEEALDGVNSTGNSVDSLINSRPPTGQPSTARDVSSEFKEPQDQLQAGNLMIGLAGGAIIVIQAGRYFTTKIKGWKREGDGSNR